MITIHINDNYPSEDTLLTNLNTWYYLWLNCDELYQKTHSKIWELSIKS